MLIDHRARRLRCGTLLAACATLSIAVEAQSEPRRYDGYFVARVEAPTPLDVQLLVDASDDVWTDDVGPGVLDVMFAPDRVAALDALGLPYRVVIPDVQVLIDTERAASPRAWFDDYHPLAEIDAYMAGLAAANPSLAQMIPIGTSIEGRTIWAMRIAGPGQSEFAPAVFYFGCQHAREWISSTIIPYLATHLLTNYGVDPNVTALVNQVEWYLVAVANPDGYEFTWNGDRMWRKNRRLNANGTIGIDTNRNWGYGWGSDNGSSGSPSSLTYRGPSPFSEPETQALRDLIIERPQIRAMNDIHSYSQLILWPWGFQNILPPDQPDFLAVGTGMKSMIASVHGLNYTAGPIYSTIYPVSGGSVDWAYGARSVFAFSFELRDTGIYGFILPAGQIIPQNEEILPALMLMTASDPVRQTKLIIPGGPPAQINAGEPTSITAVATSAVETLDPNSATLFYRYNAGEPFNALPMSHAGATFAATLPATNCLSQPQFYVAISGGNGVTTNPPGAPGATHAAIMASGGEFYSEALDANPGWLTEGLWAFGQPSGQGGSHGKKDPNTGYTGLNVYGFNLAGDYTNSMPERKLTSAPFDCTNRFGVHVSFQRWLGVERAPYDRATFQVSNDGVNWTTVWENPTTETADAAWQLVSYDIAAVADDQPAVTLRWTMGPTDGGWTYCGWNIDDIRLYTTGCLATPGDYNGDGVVNGADLPGLGHCMLGPDNGVAAGCSLLEFSGDTDIDLQEVAALQRIASD